MGTTCKTPSQKAWDIIDMIRHRDGLKYKDLAAIAGVSTNTVCSDASEQEKIPQGRLWLYFKAVGIDACDIMKSVATQAIAESQ